jgi:hypothetical protein
MNEAKFLPPFQKKKNSGVAVSALFVLGSTLLQKRFQYKLGLRGLVSKENLRTTGARQGLKFV